MRTEKHVAVIGAGVIGLCCAFYLTRRGHRVTVIDRGTPEHEGCSFGNAGMIVPSHFVPLAAPGMVWRGLKWMWNPESPFWIKPRLDRELLEWGWKFWRAANVRHVERAAPLLRDMHLASRAAFEELSRDAGGGGTAGESDYGLVKRGLLLLCKTAHGFEEEARAAEMARRLGVAAEVLDPGATAKLEPGVRMDVAGSIYFPSDCHLSPNRFMRALRARLEKAGVVFRWKSEVRSCRTAGNRIESLQDAEEICADEYVLCAGSWTPPLARQLGLKLPMQAGKGYSLTLPNPRQLPQICAIFHEARLAVTPMNGALRFGGTMEIAGLNEEINMLRVRGIIRSVPKFYPDFTAEDFADIKPWCGLRPCSPDGLPYLGRAQRYTNLIVATGHAMMGLSLAPVTGQLVAQIASGVQPFLDITQLTPDRYQ